MDDGTPHPPLLGSTADGAAERFQAQYKKVDTLYTQSIRQMLDNPGKVLTFQFRRASEHSSDEDSGQSLIPGECTKTDSRLKLAMPVGTPLSLHSSKSR